MMVSLFTFHHLPSPTGLSAPRSRLPSSSGGVKLSVCRKPRCTGTRVRTGVDNDGRLDEVAVLADRFGYGESTLGGASMMSSGTPIVHHMSKREILGGISLQDVLYESRTLFITGRIHLEFSNKMIATMLHLDALGGSKKLTLYINSPGGDLTPSLALYDTIVSLDTPIWTVLLGQAYNLAAFILAAGDKGSRCGMPSGLIVLQSPAGETYGQADAIQSETKELLRIRDYLFNELSKRTGQPVEKIFKDLKGRAKFFTAKAAAEYGIIDRILKPPALTTYTGTDPTDANRGLG